MFDRIKTVANDDIVQKVQAVYLFDVEGGLRRPLCTIEHGLLCSMIAHVALDLIDVKQLLYEV